MFGDLGKLMKLAGEMKRKMPALQARLASAEHTARAGGGAVTATVNGKGALVDLRIDPAALADPDMTAEMLADIVKAAVASAQDAAAKAAAEAMSELTGGMELPPGMGGMMP
ncbi:MAG TPA: YbaB/EbfC family nucleoid-associated protein [Phycisphaerae bacterium]|nr:YbaB/EbfC family nucleoid-associated protein [Phycisphaerae bacterium]